MGKRTARPFCHFIYTIEVIEPQGDTAVFGLLNNERIRDASLTQVRKTRTATPVTPINSSLLANCLQIPAVCTQKSLHRPRSRLDFARPARSSSRPSSCRRPSILSRTSSRSSFLRMTSRCRRILGSSLANFSTSSSERCRPKRRSSSLGKL